MPDQSPTPKRPGRRWPWIAGGSAAIVAVGLVGTAGVTGFSVRTTPPYLSWAAVQTTASPTTTALPAPQATVPGQIAQPVDAATYKAMVWMHWMVMSPLFDQFNTAVNSDPEDWLSARDAMQALQDEVKAFRADINMNLPPPSLTPLDEDLQASLDDYESGTELVITAIDENDQNLYDQGIALIRQADSHTEDALNHIMASD